MMTQKSILALGLQLLLLEDFSDVSALQIFFATSSLTTES